MASENQLIKYEAKVTETEPTPENAITTIQSHNGNLVPIREGIDIDSLPDLVSLRENLEQKNLMLTSHVHSLDQTTQELATATTELIHQNQEMALTTSTIESRVDALEPQSNILEDGINQLINTAERHKAKIEYLEADSVNITERTSALDHKSKYLEEKMLQAFADLTANFNNQTGELQYQLNILEPKSKSTEAATKSLQSSVDSLQTKTVSLDESTDSLCTRIDALEPKSIALETISTDLSSRVDALEPKTKALDHTTVHLQSRLDTLEPKSQAVANTTENLQSRLDSLEPKTKILENAVHDLQHKTTKLNETTGTQATYFRRSSWIIATTLVLLSLTFNALHMSGMNRIDATWQTLKQNVSALATVLSEQNQITTENHEHIQKLSAKIAKLHHTISQQAVVTEKTQAEYTALSQEIQQLNKKMGKVNGDLQKQIAAIAIWQPYAGKKRAVVHDKSWLNQQDPQHFTIQLTGSYRKRSIENFANSYQHLFKDKLSYYKRSHNGNDWFVLVYGNYSSFGEANQVLKSLPEPLQTNNPWIRKNAVIQKSISSRDG